MGFKFAEVDFDDLIEILFGIGIHFGIAGEVFADAIGEFSHIGSTGRAEVSLHAVVVAESRSGGADFGTHVADGAFSGATHGHGTFAEVFHNGSGSAFYGEDSSHFEDDIFGRSPAAELTG